MRNLRRQGVSQTQENERLIQQVKRMEEENKRQMQALVARHQEQIRALTAQRNPRAGPQDRDENQSRTANPYGVDRDQHRSLDPQDTRIDEQGALGPLDAGINQDQRSLDPHDTTREQQGALGPQVAGESGSWDTVSHTSSRDSVFRPGQYIVPEAQYRTPPVMIDIRMEGSYMQDNARDGPRARQNELTRNKNVQEQSDGDEDIKDLDRRLTLLRQQGFYPIDASIEVLEGNKSGRTKLRKPSFLTDSEDEKKESTQLRQQERLDDTSKYQRLEARPPLKEETDIYREHLLPYGEDARGNRQGLEQNSEQKERNAPVPERYSRNTDRNYQYIPPPQVSSACTDRKQHLRQEEIEQNRHRTVAQDRYDDSYGEQSSYAQWKRVQENLRTWEEAIRRKEAELMEREEQLAMQEKRRQEASRFREKERELKKRMELLQIREKKLSQREASMRDDEYEAEEHPQFKQDYTIEYRQDRDRQKERMADRRQNTEPEHRLTNTIEYRQDRDIQRERMADSRQNIEPEHRPTNKIEYSRERNAAAQIEIDRLGEMLQNTEFEHPLSNRELPQERLQGTSIQREHEPARDHVLCNIGVNTDSSLYQDTERGNDRRKVIDMHVDAPKFSPFSGEDPKPKNEASFEEWKYEVNCTRENGELSESMIAQLIRKSLRNPAKKILLPLGTSASVQTMMGKLEGVFGNVAKGHTILKEFYTATQLETESSRTWGLRLEDILQKAIDKGYVRNEDKNNMLKEQFWTALRSERLKNATRVKYEFTDDFETLRSSVRTEEQEMNQYSNLKQQQAASSQYRTPTTDEKLLESSKLDQVIEGLQTLTKEVKEGNKKNRYKPWFNKDKQHGNNNADENQDNTHDSQKNKQPLN